MSWTARRVLEADAEPQPPLASPLQDFLISATIKPYLIETCSEPRTHRHFQTHDSLMNERRLSGSLAR